MASILALSGGPPAHTSCGRSIELPGSDTSVSQPPRAGLCLCVRGSEGLGRAWPEGHQLHLHSPRWPVLNQDSLGHRPSSL